MGVRSQWEGRMARILIVDDMPEVRSSLRRLMERDQHSVGEAGSGGEALRALQADSYDLVITDINMPDMDGIELILAVGNTWPRLPIVAISGGGLLPKDLLLANAQALGVVATLEKPIDVDTMRSTVERALASRAD